MTRPMTDSEVCDLIEAVSWEPEAAKERIAELERIVSINGETLDRLRNRVYALEHDTPQARRLQYELDLTLADNATAGYGNDEER